MRKAYDYSQKRRSRRRYGLNFGAIRFRKDKLVANLSVALVVLIVFSFLLVVGLFAWYSKDLPQPDKVRQFNGLSTIIYSRNGEPLYDIYAEQNLVPLKLEEVPEYLKQATIAIEDQDFYTHSGFSIAGMIRGAFRSIFLGKVQGGSTLTQQLVKNALLTTEKSLPRKVKELILSIQIERKYTKDEILEMYLNNIPYGGTAWGTKTAAETYFDKDVSELNLVESAILAGLPQSPTRYSPYGPNPTAYISRTKNVLRRMREDKYITKDEEKSALSQLDKVIFSGSGAQITAAHFVMYVKQLLVDQYGESEVEQGGLRVTTTLDLELQEDVEKIILEEIDKVTSLNVTNGAVVAIDPQTGEVVAMVGSKNYSEAGDEDEEFEGKFNVAVQGLRQPGSAIKPFTYATALSKGYTADKVLVDSLTEFPGGEENPEYTPENYDGKYRGPLQLRYGLANSINTIAVKTLALVGVEDMMEIAFKMGFTTLEPTRSNINRFGLSITLGGGEVRLIDMTSAFGVFGASGVRHEPVAILKVEDSNGKTLFEHKQSRGKEVLEPGVAYIISDILSDNEARSDVFGPNSYLNIPGHKVAVKTGTTNDFRDNWTIGYTKDITVGVWVGNNDNSPMKSVASGVTGAAPIWSRIMRSALATRDSGFGDLPDNIVQIQVDKFAGGIPVGGQATRTEYFVKGTEPEDISPIYKRLKVSRSDSNRLANSIEIAKGEYDEKDYIVLQEKDPFGTDTINRWQAGINKWLESVEDSKYHPPTETTSTDESSMVINFKDPEDHKQYDETKIRIRAQAVSGSSIKKIEVFIDGTSKHTENSDKVDVELELSKGAHTIKVRAENDKGNSAESERKIGVQVPWDSSPTSTPTPSQSPTPLISTHT